MNFLAHLILAPQSPHGMVGALLPDLLRGPLPKSLHPEVLLAAREHQSIDRATDRHPAFLRTRDRLRPSCDRFAGIVADIFFDHALSHTWADHHPQPLPHYADRVAHTLTNSQPLIPFEMRPITVRMIEQAWLNSYTTPQGIELTLQRVSQRITERLGRAVDLTPATQTLLDPDNHARLLADFGELWPDLLRHVADRRQSELDPPRRAAS